VHDGPGRPGGARIGVGGGFQPIPGAQAVRVPGEFDGDDAAHIPASAGTPVHAVVAGMVLDVDGHGGLALRAADGFGFRYTGLDPGSVTVGYGGQVTAGDILGTLGGSVLELRATGPDGHPVDAVNALLGLADPNELGYRPTGTGIGDDPDPMDREIIASGLPGPR
jgi:murein DD-endopeptidase MepM/ murein hydrolase activator NlpD